MDATGWIALWAALFLGTHLAIASQYARPRLLAALGEQSYRAVYSLVAFATLGPLIYVFARHKHAGPLLWYLRDVAPMRWLAWLLMLVSLVMFVASLLNPSPVSMGAQADRFSAHGILKVTRHPGFVAFSLFGIAHLLMNGWAGDMIFFGLFPVIGVIGAIHQDSRKVRELGERYRTFCGQTSMIPMRALLDGRQHWTAADMPWAAIVGGVALTVAVVFLHPTIFGGRPLE